MQFSAGADTPCRQRLMDGRPSALLCTMAIAAVAVVYGSLPSVFFFADDFLHLFSIIDANLGEYLLRPHGGHILVVRNAVFIAFYKLFGLRAELYFWVVLLTHLVNAF